MFYLIHKLFRDKSLILCCPRIMISQDNFFKKEISFSIKSLTHLPVPLGSFTPFPGSLAAAAGGHRLLCAVTAHHFVPILILRHRESPQALPSTAKLPEPRVDLLNIAAPPAKSRWICSIGCPVFEHAPRQAAQAEWNCWSSVAMEEQGKQGHPAQHQVAGSH